MYAKIFQQIFHSTIASDWQVRHVFEDFLKLADEDGIVDMPFDSVVRRINVPAEIVKRAIAILESPDPQSRTPDHEGRRLLRLYEDQEWGWIIANHTKYRVITNREELKRQVRERVIRFRSKNGQAIEEPAGYVYYALYRDMNHIKIGFSLNPWARLRELRIAIPTLEIVATERGTRTTETTRHEMFEKFRIDREWFNYDVVIKNFLKALKNDESATTNVTTPLPTETVAATAPQKQRQKEKQKEMEKKREVSADADLPLPVWKKETVLPKEACFWNEHCGSLPKCLCCSKSRMKHLMARRHDPFWAENFEVAVAKVSVSKFCNGESDRGWTASFDWMIKPDTIAKVMEGKYDNRPVNGHAPCSSMRLIEPPNKNNPYGHITDTDQRIEATLLDNERVRMGMCKLFGTPEAQQEKENRLAAGGRCGRACL